MRSSQNAYQLEDVITFYKVLVSYIKDLKTGERDCRGAQSPANRHNNQLDVITELLVPVTPISLLQRSINPSS